MYKINIISKNTIVMKNINMYKIFVNNYKEEGCHLPVPTHFHHCKQLYNKYLILLYSYKTVP